MSGLPGTAPLADDASDVGFGGCAIGDSQQRKAWKTSKSTTEKSN
jgi:hypothetical protein